MIKIDNITDFKDTRSGFGDALFHLGGENNEIVALCADLIGSLKMDKFVEAYNERFFQIGIAEANMIGIAAGLALEGKVAFAGSFAAFVTGRVYDQIRQSVCYSNLNVKICGSHAGLTLGEDGATHQILEDIGLMKMLPNMVVINPCDYNQTYLATKAVAEYIGPCYLRFGRPVVPNFTSIDSKFEIGKGILMEQGGDVTIIATGHLVYEALVAAKRLREKGVTADVINIHTIKPLDRDIIINSIRKTGACVTAEEHFINGGLGDSVAQLLARELPTPMEMVAVDDKFGQSGTPKELLVNYRLDALSIEELAMKAVKRK